MMTPKVPAVNLNKVIIPFRHRPPMWSAIDMENKHEFARRHSTVKTMDDRGREIKRCPTTARSLYTIG